MSSIALDHVPAQIAHRRRIRCADQVVAIGEQTGYGAQSFAASAPPPGLSGQLGIANPTANADLESSLKAYANHAIRIILNIG